MAKNIGVKIMAFLALFGIIIGIVGTGLLIIFGNSQNTNNEGISQEQYLEIQKMIEAQSGAINIQTETTTLTGETK